MLKGLTIYDPRFSDRSISTDQGLWNSAAEQVVFFETDIYALYTDSKYVGELLEVLLSESKTPRIGLRVSALRSDCVASWLQHGSEGETSAIVNATELPRVIEFFEKQANHETWDFYGLESPINAQSILRPFPELLESTRQFSFVVEIDLDSILMGFCRVDSNADKLVDRLGAVQTNAYHLKNWPNKFQCF